MAMEARVRKWFSGHGCGAPAPPCTLAKVESVPTRCKHPRPEQELRHCPPSVGCLTGFQVVAAAEELMRGPANPEEQMERYDWDRGFGRDYPRGRYGAELNRGSTSQWGSRAQQERNRFGGSHRSRSAPYDRGVYGEDFPGHRGFSGGRMGGRDYGPGEFRSSGEYDRPFRSWEQGFSGGGGQQGELDRWSRSRSGGYRQQGSGGYDFSYAREPFMPEYAYQRHPEYDRPQRHLHDRWPDDAAGSQRGYELSDDEEIQQAVRQNLFQDNWVDAERIDVEVSDGVVTLTGEVDDFLEARYAWDDAWETSGVRGVVNHIHVRMDGPAGEHDTMVQSAGSQKRDAAAS